MGEPIVPRGHHLEHGGDEALLAMGVAKMLVEIEYPKSVLRLTLADRRRHADSVDTRVDGAVLILLMLMPIILVGSISKGNRDARGRHGACV